MLVQLLLQPVAASHPSLQQIFPYDRNPCRLPNRPETTNLINQKTHRVAFVIDANETGQSHERDRMPSRKGRKIGNRYNLPAHVHNPDQPRLGTRNRSQRGRDQYFTNIFSFCEIRLVANTECEP